MSCMLVYIHRWRNQGGYGGYTTPLNNNLKWLSPLAMWADRVLLVANACMVLLRAYTKPAWFKILKYLKSVVVKLKRQKLNSAGCTLTSYSKQAS